MTPPFATKHELNQASRACRGRVCPRSAHTLRQDTRLRGQILEDRFLEGQRILEVVPADPVPPLSEVPTEFAARGVLVWRATFESV